MSLASWRPRWHSCDQPGGKHREFSIGPVAVIDERRWYRTMGLFVAFGERDLCLRRYPEPEWLQQQRLTKQGEQ